MRRSLAIAALLLGAFAAPAAAQTPIPEGDYDAPAFIGAKATPQPITGASPLAPRHPFMAPNGLSNIHDDAYQTDTYEGPGPLGDRTRRTSTFLARDCASVTFDRRGRIVTVCVGLEGPQLHLMDAVTLRTLATYDLPPREPGGGNPFQDFTGGGYFYLDERDRVIVPTTTRRLLVIEQTQPNPGFRVARDVDLAASLPRGDKIVAVMPDWAGRIWFVSASGVVGTVARDADRVQVHATNERISNSFAVDESGGVYIVTDGAMYRFDAAPDGKPVVTWREGYGNSGIQKPGQVNAGSGTTPTLMQGGLVAITDNADPMNVVVMQRGRQASGARTICAAPVFNKGESATDNSLIGFGRSIIVENNYGYSGPTTTQNGGSTTPGVERVDVDPEARTCRKVWRSEERSPTVVPKASLANGLVYVYVKEPTDNGDDLWYFTAVDYRTGRTVYKVLSGEGLGYNNNYAPITLAPDGSAYIGVLGGLVRLADAVPPPGAVAPSQRSDGAAGRDRARCIPRRARITPSGVAPALLRAPRVRLSRAGGLVVEGSVRFCVVGGGLVGAAYDRRGTTYFVVTNARGHRIRRVGPGSPTRAFRRAFPNRRRVARGVYRVGRRLLFHVRARRVTWVAAAGPKAQRTRASLRTALREAGF